MKLFRAKPVLSDPRTDETKIRDTRPESLACLVGVTAKAESHLLPRCKQMKDMRPFEGIITEFSNGLFDPTRLSIPCWNAGLKRGEVTNSVVGSNHVIRLQEAESHLDEIVETVAEQFNIFQSVDQLILFHKKTFEPGGVQTEGVIPSTSKQYPFLPEVHTCLCSTDKHDREQTRNCKNASGPERRRPRWRRLQHFGLPRTRKGEAQLNRRSVGRDAFDSSA